MKYLMMIYCLSFLVNLDAQTLVFGNEEIEFEGEQVFSVLVKTEPNVKTIRSNFEEWMDDKHDVDLDGRTLLFFNKDHLTGKGVVIPEISNKKIDVIAIVDESKDGVTKLNVIASFGYNNWFDPYLNPVEFLSLQDLVFDFIENYLPEYYMNKVDESKENIADLNENRSEFQEEIMENMNEIEELHRENSELQEKLKSNQMKINEAKKKLDKRKKEQSKIEDKINKTTDSGK